MNKPDRIAALTHIGCPAIVFDTSAPLPMRLLSIRPVGRLMTKLQPPSEHQFEQLAKMVNEHPLPREIAQLIFTTERLAHFEDTFLAVLNRLLRLRGDRPDLALAAYQLARIQAPTLLVFAENGRMGAAPIGSRMADAELHTVDGGHAPWLHHADQIAPLLTTFLEAGRPRSELINVESSTQHARRISGSALTTPLNGCRPQTHGGSPGGLQAYPVIWVVARLAGPSP